MMTEKKAAEVVAGFEEKVKDMNNRINRLQRGVGELNDKIANMVKMVVGRKFPNRKQWIMYPEEGWKCESKKNPLPMCVYDEGEDTALDSCLFCHEPYERK